MKWILVFVISSSYLICFGQSIDSAAIDKIVWDNNVRKMNYPGLALGVFRNGELVYGRGYGLANVEGNVPITTRSVFDIASVSKQFTAACIFILINRGMLHLDDALTQFFPAFPAYARHINIGHLLHHTSGLRDYNSIAELKGLTREDKYSQEEIMKWLIGQKELNASPGDEYIYCNSGYWLLGQIVQQVSGKSLTRFAEDEIFKPLGMKDTYYSNAGRGLQNYAVGYSVSTDTISDYEVRDSEQETFGAGGVYTTIEDIQKWDEAFYNSKLGNNFRKQMTEPGILSNGQVLDYGSGLFLITYKGLKVIGHNGSSGSLSGHRAQFIQFPDQHFSVAIFTNSIDIAPWAMSGKIADLFLKDQLMPLVKLTAQQELKVISLTREEQNDLIEHYWSDQNAASCEVYLKKDTLWLSDELEGEKVLIPLSSTVFYEKDKPGSMLKFKKLNTGIKQLTNVVEGKMTNQLESYIPKIYLRKEKEKLVGVYHSDELDVDYHIKLEDDKLILFVNDRMIAQLEPKSENLISTGDGSIHLERNRNGIITGFTLSYFRIKNIRFKRVV